jgi:hypothetical protein
MTARDAIGRDVELDDFYAPLTRIPPDRPAFQRKSVLKRLRTAATVALLVTATIQAAGSLPVLAQAVQLVVVDVKAVAKGYRASKLVGSTVMNDKNERIGSLDDIVIGHDRVLFAILQVGGFLGIGARLVAVPFQSLTFDQTGGKITLPGASKDELKKLPEFQYLS